MLDKPRAPFVERNALKLPVVLEGLHVGGVQPLFVLRNEGAEADPLRPLRLNRRDLQLHPHLKLMADEPIPPFS